MTTNMVNQQIKIVLGSSQKTTNSAGSTFLTNDNTCKSECTNDLGCEGVLKCCPGSCGQKCIMPEYDGKYCLEFYQKKCTIHANHGKYCLESCELMQ